MADRYRRTKKERGLEPYIDRQIKPPTSMFLMIYISVMLALCVVGVVVALMFGVEITF